MRIVALRSSAIAFGLAVVLCQVPTVSFGQQPVEEGNAATSSPSSELGAGGSGLGNATPASPSSDDPAEAEKGPAEPSPDDKGETPKAENPEPKADPDAAAAMTQTSAQETGETAELKGEVPKTEMPGNTGSNGSLNYDIAIDVPAFHGLEPEIVLNYNSSRKTKLGGLYQGWLGSRAWRTLVSTAICWEPQFVE